MKAKLWANREKGTFRGVLVSQMNLQAGVPLVGTVECVIVHLRPGSQPMLAVLLMEKRHFQMVVCSSAESRDLHLFLALCVLQKKTKLWSFSYK